MHVYRFSAFVKDLEMKIQGLIGSVFTTGNTVEEGIRLLDVFTPLFARKVLFHKDIHRNSYTSFTIG